MTSYLSRKNYYRRKVVGNCVYIPLKSGINIKLYCISTAVVVKAISRTNGEIDSIELPFSDYFFLKQHPSGKCAVYPIIDGDNWRFSDHKDMLPTIEEYGCLAIGMEEFISLYDVPEEEDA